MPVELTPEEAALQRLDSHIARGVTELDAQQGMDAEEVRRRLRAEFDPETHQGKAGE